MTEHNNLQDNVTVPRELLRQVQTFCEAWPSYGGKELATTLRTALAQPAVEHEHMGTVRSKSGGGVFVQWNVQPKAGMKLYTAPQAQQPRKAVLKTVRGLHGIDRKRGVLLYKLEAPE